MRDAQVFPRFSLAWAGCTPYRWSSSTPSSWCVQASPTRPEQPSLASVGGGMRMAPRPPWSWPPVRRVRTPSSRADPRRLGSVRSDLFQPYLIDMSIILACNAPPGCRRQRRPGICYTGSVDVSPELTPECPTTDEHRARALGSWVLLHAYTVPPTRGARGMGSAERSVLLPSSLLLCCTFATPHQPASALPAHSSEMCTRCVPDVYQMRGALPPSTSA